MGSDLAILSRLKSDLQVGAVTLSGSSIVFGAQTRSTSGRSNLGLFSRTRRSCSSNVVGLL